MAEITIDNTEAAEGFSPDEQEAIQIGEQLQQEEQAKLAGKFEDAQALEKAYLELQNKFSSGQREETPEEVEPEQPKAEEKEPEVDKKAEAQAEATILEALWGEANDGKSPTKEMLEALNEYSAEDIAKMHVQYRMEQDQPRELSDSDIDQLQSIAGGGKEYNNMIGWAKENLTEKEIGMYDQVMGKGDPLACFFAVQALHSRMRDQAGYDGEMLTGKPQAQKTDSFRSQAEVVRAMQDPRYDDDPAYRDDIFQKLERSNIQY